MGIDYNLKWIHKYLHVEYVMFLFFYFSFAKAQICVTNVGVGVSGVVDKLISFIYFICSVILNRCKMLILSIIFKALKCLGNIYQWICIYQQFNGLLESTALVISHMKYFGFYTKTTFALVHAYFIRTSFSSHWFNGIGKLERGRSASEFVICMQSCVLGTLLFIAVQVNLATLLVEWYCTKQQNACPCNVLIWNCINRDCLYWIVRPQSGEILIGFLALKDKHGNFCCT